MSKITIQFKPRKDKARKCTSSTPIYVTLLFKRKKAEMRMPIELSANELSKWNYDFMRLKENNSSINLQIDNVNAAINRFVATNISEVEKMPPKFILEKSLGKIRGSEPTILMSTFLEEYFSKSVLPNKNLAQGTKKNYRKSINHLQRFLERKKLTKISLKDFSIKHAQEFMEIISSGEKALTSVSSASIIKVLRAIFNRATSLELIEKNPFSAVKISNKFIKKPHLSIHQICKIKSLDLSESPSLDLYRDIFLFFCFTGLSYKDTMCLSRNMNLEFRPNNEVKLKSQRQKTDIVTEQFLVRQVIQLIEKYSCHPQVSGTQKIIPNRSNKEMNLILKFIAVKAEIGFNLTCHTARHTFRQLLSEANIEEMGTIKRMMGHSFNGDIDAVYFNVTESRLLVAKSKLEEYLNTTLHSKNER